MRDIEAVYNGVIFGPMFTNLKISVCVPEIGPRPIKEVYDNTANGYATYLESLMERVRDLETFNYLRKDLGEFMRDRNSDVVYEGLDLWHEDLSTRVVEDSEINTLAAVSLRTFNILLRNGQHFLQNECRAWTNEAIEALGQGDQFTCGQRLLQCVIQFSNTIRNQWENYLLLLGKVMGQHIPHTQVAYHVEAHAPRWRYDRIVDLLKEIRKGFPWETTQRKLKVAEVGVWRAISSIHFMERGPQIHLYLIDPWKKAEEEYLKHEPEKLTDELASKEKVIEAMEHHKDYFPIENEYTIIEKLGYEAAEEDLKDEKLDLVFIDGDHSDRGAYMDLAAYFPLVADHGVIVGHDGLLYGSFGVLHAVQRFLKDSNIELKTFHTGHDAGTFWFYKKDCITKE